jgi:hypothetical protein
VHGSDLHKSAQLCLEEIYVSHQHQLVEILSFWVYCLWCEGCPASHVCGLVVFNLHPVGSLCYSVWNLIATIECHGKQGPWRSPNLVIPKLPLKYRF